MWMTEAQPDIPKCKVFDYASLLAEFGPYHFTSSLAWMLAAAIVKKPKVIGIFGVDMAAGEEYDYQRPGMQHFIGEALKRGIQVVLPPESDLMRPSLMYGLGEHTERFIKLNARKQELLQRKQQCEQVIQQHTAILQTVNGALENMDYVLTNWCDDIPGDVEEKAASSAQNWRPRVWKEEEVKEEVKPKRKKKPNGDARIELS